MEDEVVGVAGVWVEAAVCSKLLVECRRLEQNEEKCMLSEAEDTLMTN